MGSPLGPVFANIFLCHHEDDWVQNCPFKPSLYNRYVDDTFWLLPSDCDIPALMNYMNSRHPNMHFTCERERNDCLHFIGVTISHTSLPFDSHGYTTSLYRKPTSTPLLTNFNSFTPFSYRISVLKCLLHRAFHICSTWTSFHLEVDFIRNLLLRNCFPSWVIDRVIKSSISRFVEPKTVCGPKKDRIYLGIPYLGKVSDEFRRTIRRINRDYIPHKDIIVYFKQGMRLSNFFRTKDVTPFALQSHVVYNFTCAGCNASYIGQTARHMRHRIAEHSGTSHLTGKIMKLQYHSNIRDHCSSCPGSECSPLHFNILARGSSDFELLVKERLLIHLLKPSINGNSGAFELLLV